MIWTDTERKLQDFFEDGRLPAVLSVDRRHYDETRYKFLMHGHGNICEITYIYQGEGLYRQGKEVYPVKAGDILLYNMGELHVTQSRGDSGVSYYSIGISGMKKKGLPPNWLHRGQESCVVHAGSHEKEVHGICEEMYRLLGSKRRSRTADLAVHLLGAALIVLTEELGQAGPEKGRRQPGERREADIKAYLDRHYTEDLSLGYLASELGYSETHISHLFKKLYGESPMKYVMHRRISQAQLLLHSTDLQVSQVAARVGYGNVSYFVTLFSKVVGMTPVKYREYVKKDVHSL